MSSRGAASCLVLRLAGPLQSWGSQSRFNWRETDSIPTKSGIIGLLAAADGRQRRDPILDLVDLYLGVRVDVGGSLLRDFHTASDPLGRPLLSAAVSAKGLQKRTSPTKYTAVTQRFYLQDAAFVAALEGDSALLEGLAAAISTPEFPLALGRRSCVPTLPIHLRAPDGDDLWPGTLRQVLTSVPWIASQSYRRRLARRQQLGPTTTLLASIEDPNGQTDTFDVPGSFDQTRRSFSIRRVDQVFIEVPTGVDPDASQGPAAHDPLELLGGSTP